MKIGIKLLAVAILSLTMGIACASPLFITELNIRPYLNYVQGQTVQFNINVVYANFTVQNADQPVEQDSGPTISYFVVVNITNPSDLGATLTGVHFEAAPEIVNVPSSMQNGSIAYEAPGAWVDGKYYNLTWVDIPSPYIGENGKLVQSEFKIASPYWMQGVQVFDTYVNGNVTSTYLNMNGTWTDVTGHIEVAERPLGSQFSYEGPTVVDNTQAFSSVADANYSSNGIIYDTFPPFGSVSFTNHLVGQGFFNNTWKPHQSRLVAISGSWEVLASWDANDSSVKAIQAGNLTFMTQTSNFVELLAPVNNTVINTSSENVEIKQVQLAQNENSYLYNPLSLDNNAFQIDKWGVEATLRSRMP
jgi:hypothetical protein